jgi:hypothetical protein
VSSAKSVRERDAVKRYLEQLDAADEQDEVVIDPSAVAAALEKLKSHPEPEARFMRMGSGRAPAYNVQTAVDAEHALIVAQEVTTEGNDQRSLLPMAEAAKQAEACEAQGIVPNVPTNRAVTTRVTARCLTGASSPTTRRQTRSAVPRTRRSPANNSRAEIVPSTMPPQRKPAAPVS